MSVAKWELMNAGLRCCSIDGIQPTTTYNPFNLGIFYLGGTKGGNRRVIVGFNILGVPEVGSLPNYSIDLLNSAYIEGDCTSLIGAGGRAAKISRMKRADWDYTVSNWNNYKAATGWQAIGCIGADDYDITTPPQVSITTPTVTGAFTWTGLLGHAEDALDFRGGVVLLRFNLDNELDDGVDRMMSAQIGDIAVAPTTMLFCIDYTPGAISDEAPTSIGSGGGRDLQPRYDHLLARKPEGRLIRDLRASRAGYQEAVRG